MQTEFPREKLTKKHIRKDIKDLFMGGILAGGLFAFFFMPLHVLVVNVAGRLTDSIVTNALEWFSALLFMITVAILVLVIVYTLRLFVLLYKEQYTVTTAPLIDKKERVGTQYGRSVRSQPYRLYFPSHREYALGIRNYEWSEMYNLTEEGAYRYSDIGDEFYLVEDKRGKILAAYNTKLFELQDE